MDTTEGATSIISLHHLNSLTLLTELTAEQNINHQNKQCEDA